MSIAQIENSATVAESVMVRAYAGEPVRLRALGRRDGVVDVVGSDPNAWIGFPASDVFHFDEAVFSQLVKAHGTGDRDQLASLWSTAERY